MTAVLQALLAQPGGATAVVTAMMQAMQQRNPAPAGATTPMQGGRAQTVQFTTPAATAPNRAPGVAVPSPEDAIAFMHERRFSNGESTPEA